MLFVVFFLAVLLAAASTRLAADTEAAKTALPVAQRRTGGCPELRVAVSVDCDSLESVTSRSTFPGRLLDKYSVAQLRACGPDARRHTADRGPSLQAGEYR
ncbi:MAG: hypothetical protein GY944_11780 [bacterium]|nr:hypothetical protein [bacterium]